MKATDFPFTDPTFIDELEQGVASELQFDQTQEMFNISRLITDYFRENPRYVQQHPDLAERCKKVLIQTSWIGFSLLPEKEYLDLLRSSLKAAYQIPYFNLLEKIKPILFAHGSLPERDKAKQVLRQAMLENDESFRAAAVALDVQAPQTIGHWLKHYNVYVNGRIGRSIERAQYFTEPPAASLSDEQKEFLKKLIEVFDYLKLSSQNLESDLEFMPVSIEGKPYVYRAGELEPVDTSRVADTVKWLREQGFLKGETPAAPKASLPSKLPPTTPLEPSPAPRVVTPPPRAVPPSAAPRPVATAQVVKTTMSAAKTPVAKEAAPVPAVVSAPAPKPKETPQVVVPTPAAAAKPVSAPPLKAEPQPTAGLTAPSLLASAAVVAEEKRLLAVSTPEKLHDEIWLSLSRRSQAPALAALKLLAASAELLNILKTDSRFYYALANYYRVRHDLNALKDFHMSFANPRYTKELVRYILESALKISTSEAAHVSIDLVNMMKERGVRLEHWGYYDEQTHSYHWL